MPVVCGDRQVTSLAFVKFCTTAGSKLGHISQIAMVGSIGGPCGKVSTNLQGCQLRKNVD